MRGVSLGASKSGVITCPPVSGRLGIAVGVHVPAHRLRRWRPEIVPYTVPRSCRDVATDQGCDAANGTAWADAVCQWSKLFRASRRRPSLFARWPIQDEHVGRVDLGDAVPALSPFNEAVAEPAHNVNQSASGEVSSDELSQAISHDHGVPVRSVTIARPRIGRNAETGPYVSLSFRREMNVGVSANSPDELHICS